jgi:hypothetical protein
VLLCTGIARSVPGTWTIDQITDRYKKKLKRR